MKEQAAREKPAGSDEKRELAGDDSYVDSNAAKETRANALDNPLTGISLDRLEAMGRAFAREKGLGEFELEFAKGAQAAQDATVTDLPLLDEEDREILRREVTHKWSHPKTVRPSDAESLLCAAHCLARSPKLTMSLDFAFHPQLYFVVVACSMAAATQGMDESVTNGANLFWAPQFGLITAKGTPGASRNQWLLGLTAGSPYLCCAVLGCWLTSPVNKVMGRRYAMALAAAISFIGCIWSACVNSWQHLLGARFFLGIGVGLGSATVPVFAAETAPPLIRGALVMQ